MKSVKILSLLIVAILLFTACKSKQILNNQIIALKNVSSDVTHDGEKEKFVRQLSGAENGEACVEVYTKIDDKYRLIWMDKLGTAKNDQKGIYLCKKSGLYDLLIWKPTTDGDVTTLEYSIFYLEYNNITKEAKPVQELHDKITFTKEEVTKNGDKYEEASNFVYTLNKYISKSAALIDTVGGEVLYSPTAKELKTNPYYPKWYDKKFEPKVGSVTSTPSNTLSSNSSRIESEPESSMTESEMIESQDSLYDDVPENNTTAE